MQQAVFNQQSESNRLFEQNREQLFLNMEILQYQAVLIENLTSTVQQQQHNILQMEQQIIDQDQRFSQKQSEQEEALNRLNESNYFILIYFKSHYRSPLYCDTDNPVYSNTLFTLKRAV